MRFKSIGLLNTNLDLFFLFQPLFLDIKYIYTDKTALLF